MWGRCLTAAIGRVALLEDDGVTDTKTLVDSKATPAPREARTGLLATH